jgi:tRNA (cmo5U34)-methyltransferase
MAVVTASAWQQGDVATAYLDRRSAIPLWGEQADVVRRLLTRSPRPITRFVDLGTGDGLLASLALDACPGSEAVLVDFSRPMLDAAAERLRAGPARWQAVEADLSASTWLDSLPPGLYDAVISSFCIHHLPHERKRELYAEVFRLLAPGGLFLNWEHVSTEALAKGMFDEAMVEGLARLQPDRDVNEVAREYHERPDARENKLLDVHTQSRWLREIGFEQVDIYFKWVELAVFGGVKSEAASIGGMEAAVPTHETLGGAEGASIGF